MKGDGNRGLLEDQQKNGGNLEPFDEEDSDTQCGVGSCKPQPLQKFANIAAFTGFYSIAGILSSTLLSYVNSQITTLERQFGLSSSETGIVLASNDIGYMILAFFIGHFAFRTHIPRVLSISVMLFGVSGIVCCLPHFLFGAGKLPEGADDFSNITLKTPDSASLLCVLNDTITDFCKGSDGSDEPEVGTRRPREHATAALAIIVTGMVLQGLAKAPRNPFLVTYVDENVEKVKTGYYLGIIVSTSIIGPALAFGLGSYFTRIYVTLQDTTLYPRHPRWIGAWWLGYLVFGIAAIIVSIPTLFFPRRLKSAPKKNKKTNNKTQKSHAISKRVLLESKDYMKNLISILTNPVFMTIIVSKVIHLFAVGGGHAFTPKYLENQFGIPAWKANLLMAGFSMPAAAVGSFVGGWLMKKYKVSPMASLKYAAIGLFVTTGVVALGFVFGCPQPQILYQPGSPELGGNCSNSCHCSNDFLPICGSDNNNYYSPCHAGCLVQNGQVYENCSCIPDVGKATAGMCDYDCPYLYPYVLAKAVVSLLSTFLLMPKFIAMIRCVSNKEKPMAVAFSACVTSLFGWLLGPIIYGRVVDSACLIWDSSCGERGACAMYDIDDFRIKMHGFYVVSRGLSLILLCLAILIAAKTKRFEKNVLEEENE